MSQTFLEDIPEFLEIQRDSFLRILDTGLIEAFEKINPIVPTSQCQYGLLFYPKEYVLILPENTITEAFLQGKTYGCKIYVPAVIFDIEKFSIAQKKAEKRFKFVQALRFPKTTNARFSETSLFGFQEKNSNISVLRSTTNLIGYYRKGKKTANLSFSKRNKLLLNFELVLPLFKSLHSFLENKKTNWSSLEIQKQASKVSSFTKINSYNIFNKSSFLTPVPKGQTARVTPFSLRRHLGTPFGQGQGREKNLELNLSQRRKKWHLSNSIKKKPKKNLDWLDKIFGSSLINQTLDLSNVQTTNQLDPEVVDREKKSSFDNLFLEKQTFPRLFTPLKINQPIWKWTLHYKIKNRANLNSGLVLSLETAQKTKKKLSFRIKSKEIELSTKINSRLPKNIRQKSKLGFFDKVPLWLRGRSNTSLLEEAIKKLSVLEEGLTIQKKKKPSSKDWFFPFATKSLINSKKAQDSYLLENVDKPFSKFNFDTMSMANNARLLSSKEWVCIGVLPLMTPRGHFIINGSHRIIISQMARAPGLYYQTGEKLQATIVPSKGAWLRISVKANETGEIKIWVRITPQRKMPYKIFIETYKFLENSKTSLSPGGSKFLNLVYKNLNSKIKHLDKHYAIGVISGQINRTLFNPTSYSLGSLGRMRLNERLGINDKNGYLTSKDLSKIKDNLLKLLGQKTSDLSADDIDHLENRRVRTCGELLQTEIDTGMTRLKKAIGKQLDEYSNPDSSIFNTFKSSLSKTPQIKEQKKENNFGALTSIALWAIPSDARDSGERAIPKGYAQRARANKSTEHSDAQILSFSEQMAVLRKPNHNAYKQKNFYLLTHFNHQNFWHLYLTISEQNISFFKQQKSDQFWKKNKNLFFIKKSLYVLSRSTNSSALFKNFPLIFKQNKIGIILADARLYKKKSCIINKLKNEENSSSPKNVVEKNVTLQKNNVCNISREKVLLSPSKIIGTKAFAGALREFFGSNPLSQYMDQTNPLAEITHKRRLSSLGPGGVDRASAGIAIRGIHPSHYGRICPIETPEGKNAGLVNSMTMWARINDEGFLETPYFKVNGGSLMSHSHTLVPQWNFLSTKTESKQALKIVSSDLKITQSAFLPSIALPTRDGSERSFGRKKREVVHLCGISPMQNISVATSLIPFLEHDDATRALMGSNMQRQAVPLLKATAPLIRTGLEGKVVGESGHALQASCSGLISTVTRTFISIDSFDTIPKTLYCTLTRPRFLPKETNLNKLTQFSKISQLNSQKIEKSQKGQSKDQFIGCVKKLPFLKELLGFSTQEQSYTLPYNLQKNRLLENILLFSTQKLTTKTLSRNLWRKGEKVKRQRKIQNLQQYTRSNQATVCVQRPAVTEGRWVQKGDLIGDCSASKNGVLALGQNIVVAYLPMEGFNFEDAIVVSDRLVREELYTSIHVQRIEFDMDAVVKKYIPRKIKVKKQKSAYKTNTQDWITFYNPHLLQSEKQNLNPLGIIKVGSWVEPGDVLVSKVVPVERKIAPSRHLLAAVFQEKKTKILDTDDTSIRVPKGIHGRVINVKIVGTGKNASESLMKSCASLSLRKKKSFAKSFYSLDEPNNPLIQGQLASTSTVFVNSEQTQRSEKGEQELPLLNKSTAVNKANAFSQKSSNYDVSSFSGTKPFFLNTEFSTNSLFLEDKARKMKIIKSWSYTSALANSQFIVNFGTLPSIFQLFPNKEAFSYSSSRLFNLISYSNFLEINKIAEQKHNIFFKKTEKDNMSQVSLLEKLSLTENRQNYFGKRSNTIANTFIDLIAKDQAETLIRKKLPSIIIKNYYESINNCIPSLLRRIVFRELINNCLPITQVLEPFQLKFGSTKHSILPSNPTSTTFFNKPEFFEKFQDWNNINSLKLKETKLSSNSFVKYNNQDLINFTRKKSINSQDYKITGVRIYIAERKKLQVGDKMSGRHGNKGIVSTILPREDMPYLPDGTPIDMVLNPLGIPSRMNVGQVFECLLGLAASICNKSIGHTPFDEMYGPEASRSLVYLFLYVSRLRSRADWLFQPKFPGKTVLFDGRTGTPFEQWVTVGRAYMLKLIHMVDEKIHARSIGPRSLVTQQPVKGRARGGGQRLGEMEIWALEGFGAAYILQEILTIKSDDIIGRENVETSIISATSLSCSIPETFRITLFELRCLCLNIELTQNF